MAQGLSLEHRTGQYGEYDVVMYNSAAQRFILKNLDAIAAYRVGKDETIGTYGNDEP